MEVKRLLTLGALAVLFASLLGYAVAQKPFQQGAPVVVVTPLGLNLRAAPGLGGERIAVLPYGTLGYVTEGTPLWADGFWWWRARFDYGRVEGWVAEGTASEVLLDDWSRRDVVEAFSPFGNTERWANIDFVAGLALGLTMSCRDAGYHFSAESFMGAPFPVTSCANPYSYHQFDMHYEWENERPFIGLVGAVDISGGIAYLVHYSPQMIRGSGNYQILNVYVQPTGGTQRLAYGILSQGGEFHEETAEVSFLVRLHLPGDSNNRPSFHIHQRFAIRDHGLVLVERETVLNEDGGLAQRLRDEMRREGVAPVRTDTPVVNEIMREVSRVALNQELSQEQRSAQLHVLQDRWDAQLLAVAVRVMPVYDPGSGSWRSVDSVAREMVGGVGHESPFTRDPVGATVRMFFDPSPSNVANLLSVPMPFGW